MAAYLRCMDTIAARAIAKKNTPDAHSIQFAALSDPNQATTMDSINVIVPAKYIGIATRSNMSLYFPFH